MEATIYNEKGKSAGTINLPESVFGLSLNNDMVHQVVTSLLTNKRKPVAHTKDRSEVAGGGKKPWQQKGTGRARHGSIRSPLWVGGGVTHGPNNKKSFDRKVNKAMKTQTLFMILSEKFRNGEIMFVDSISLAKPKTSDAKVILSALDGVKGFKGVFSKKNNATLFALNTKNLSVEKSLRNFNNISFNELRNINPVDVLNYKYLVITEPKEAVEFLEKKLAK